MQDLLAASSVALGLVLLGCDPAAPTPATPSSSVPASPTGPAQIGQPEGGECGDDVAVQKKCATGLVCAPATKGPVSEHMPGVCKKP